MEALSNRNYEEFENFVQRFYGSNQKHLITLSNDISKVMIRDMRYHLEKRHCNIEINRGATIYEIKSEIVRHENNIIILSVKDGVQKFVARACAGLFKEEKCNDITKRMTIFNPFGHPNLVVNELKHDTGEHSLHVRLYDVGSLTDKIKQKLLFDHIYETIQNMNNSIVRDEYGLTSDVRSHILSLLPLGEKKKLEGWKDLVLKGTLSIDEYTMLETSLIVSEIRRITTQSISSPLQICPNRTCTNANPINALKCNRCGELLR